MATINGTSGVDNLIGTSEGDNILGGLGDDILTGGGGADRFFFNNISDTIQFGSDMFIYSTDGCDIIRDFYDAEDSIVSVDYTRTSTLPSYEIIRGVNNLPPYESENFVGSLTTSRLSSLNEITVGSLTTLGSSSLNEIAVGSLTTLGF